jgi:hypothetical protein
MNSKLPVFIIIALILVGGGYYLFTRQAETDTEEQQNQNTTNTNTPPVTTNTTTGTPGGQNSVDTTNVINVAENVSGNSARITDAKLAKPGFIVIYRVNGNSDSEILGHSALLGADSYTNLEIKLTKSTTNNQALVAVLHEDDGDGKFEFPDSDFYLGNATERVVMDVDVVGVSGEDERPILDDQVDLFLKNAYSTTSLYTR